MGGTKKSTVGYQYFLGMHMVMCYGPIDRIGAVYGDEKLAGAGDWTGGPFVVFEPALYGGDDKEGGLAGVFNFLQGKPDQPVNAYLWQRLFPNAVPFWRGVASVVMEQIYVGTQSYVKKIGFLISRIHTRGIEGNEQWYDEKAEIGFSASERKPTLVGDTTRTTPGTTYKTSMSYSDGTYLYIFEGTSPLYEDGDVNFYRRSLDGATEELIGSYPATYNGTCLDCWADVPIYVTTNDSGSLSVQEYNGTSLTTTLFDVSACGANAFNLGNQSSTYYQLGSERFYLVDDDSNTGTATIFDLSSGFPLAVLVTDASSTHSAIVEMFLGASLIYTITDTVILVAYNRSWVEQWSVDLSSALTVGHGIGGSTVVIREEYDGQVMICNDYTYIRVSAGGFTNYGILDPSPGEPVIGYEEHGGSVIVNSTWYGLNAPANKVRAVRLSSTTTGGDMNPAHIIRECLTDPDWGMGYQDADIDDTSFTYAADVLYDELMGISIIWNNQSTIEDFIKEITRHINATIYVDKSTGKFVLKLIREDYSLGSLITLDPSNIDHIDDFTRPSFGELTNSITVGYWDSTTFKDGSLTVQDIALAQMQGVTINTTQQYPGFTNAALAARIAQRDLRTLSTPIASCTLYCNRDAYPLNIGDVFKLTWPDYLIENLVMRVTGIAYGDGKSNQIRLTCTQDIYNMPAIDSVLVVSPPVIWEDPNTAPVAATKRLAYEVPYLEAVQQHGQASVDSLIATDPALGYAGISIGRPSPATLNASMWTNSGGGYAFQATIDFTPTAALNANAGKLDTVLVLTSPVDIALAPNGKWLQIGNEIMVKVSYAAPNLTVKRGALDTVPAEHSSGANVFFWDDFSANDETQYVDGETVNIKVTPVTGLGELPLAGAPADALNIVGRMAKPYPPGQFKIDGSYYPAIAGGTFDITWVHRDRLLQTGTSYLGFVDSGVGPEAGTTYNVRIFKDSDNTLLYDNLGISGTSDTGISLVSDDTIRVELESIRDSLISYQKHVHVLDYTTAGGIDGRITEAGDSRITEAGDSRIIE